MNNAISAGIAVVSGFIGLAILSVLVSPRAQTASVITSTGGALSTVIRAAVSPVNEGGGASFGGTGGGGGFGWDDAADVAKIAAMFFA